MSPRKASGAPITDVTAVSAFAAEGSTYSFAGEFGSTNSGVKPILDHPVTSRSKH